ncbi:MAG: class I SAM-dependent methyltransferase [Propionibacteriales bacterium]|nr:class I SAM-dependent methyltransferase [Propionibacteriales bacterium]
MSTIHRGEPSGHTRFVYPETGAGGFTHLDGTVQFYGRVSALLEPSHTIADLGAGRGSFLEDPVSYRRELRRLQGKAHRVIGLDIDPVVLSNPTVDEAHVLVPGGPFPLSDGSVDLIVSDFSLEHVDDPDQLAAEIRRVLRPGGWFCARTPNKWGYIGVAARIVPNRLHSAVLRRLQPTKPERDTFPTRYRMNTLAELRRRFPPSEFVHCSYAMECEPTYVGTSRALQRATGSVLALLPRRFGSVLYVFVQKRP